jgi:serine/threonine-protein kinase PRP4
MLTNRRLHHRNEPAAEEDPEPESEVLDEEALIEQRRKRREAIKAKYRGSAPPLLVQALQLGDRPGQSQSDDGSTPTRSSRFSSSSFGDLAKSFRG